jgi:hypothetical protein
MNDKANKIATSQTSLQIKICPLGHAIEKRIAGVVTGVLPQACCQDKCQLWYCNDCAYIIVADSLREILIQLRHDAVLRRKANGEEKPPA